MKLIERSGAAGKPADVAAAIEVLKAQKERLQAQAQDMAARGLKQKVMTEPEAKLMRTPHGHAVAYNAQTAVDAKHKLIAAFDLTNEGNDYGQLHPMAVQGKEAVGADEVTVVADTGYSNGEHGAQMRAGQDHGDRAETRDGQSEGHAILSAGTSSATTMRATIGAVRPARR